MTYRFMPYQERDEERVLGWITDERSFYQWSGGVLGSYPPAPGTLNSFYREWKTLHKYMVFCLCDEDMEPVGQMILRYPKEDPCHIRFGFIMVDPAERGKGLGRKMVEMAIDYARDFLQVETISLGVYTNNEGPLRMYESMGFCATGEAETEEHMGECWQYAEMRLVPGKAQP